MQERKSIIIIRGFVNLGLECEYGMSGLYGNENENSIIDK